MAQEQISSEEGTILLQSIKAQGSTAGNLRSSMISSSFNFINSIIGSGIIGLPYALNQAGLPFGLLLLIVVGFITDYTIILLIKGGNLSGTNSYQALVQSTFGFPGFLILSVLQFLYPFIAMISYNITTGDTLTKVFLRIPGVGPSHILANRHFVILVITVLFTLPLSLYRNIERLGKVSFLSMVLTLTVLIIVIIRSATLGPEIPPTDSAWAFAKINAIQAVGVMSFAFICHHNSFLIYGSLQNPTLSRWTIVTHVSVGSALVISAVFAVAGYATFTGYTQGDIFENYCRDDNLATFGRFCFGLSIITTFPLECFVTREVLSNVMCYRELSRVKHGAITFLIVAVCTAISVSLDCLALVMELNGALSAIPLMFILPSACYLKLSPGRWFHSHNLGPCVLIGLGLFFMITGLTLTGVFQQDCSHGVEMFYCTDTNVSSTLAP
ncbi:putative sodium-coupled neutral amino acid transporter 11 [Periophthalmus magnuspinnatus]|uniref:putative sodium-coupled neutral amino acid transporter 11 n=1 Tax=Periophthalmus magnuspinnatus TaxID=409849 RepID=UPI002436D3DD|nr:putative sodium-coupled neutral amino acid transporter 11 [Periophthalmus magnuspinnatus]